MHTCEAPASKNHATDIDARNPHVLFLQLSATAQGRNEAEIRSNYVRIAVLNCTFWIREGRVAALLFCFVTSDLLKARRGGREKRMEKHRLVVEREEVSSLDPEPDHDWITALFAFYMELVAIVRVR